MDSSTAPAPGQGLRFRASFTLPADTAKRLSKIAKRLGVTQSALLAELLEQPLAVMDSVLSEIPDVGVREEHVRRARGRSQQLITDAVHQALAVVQEASDEPNPQLDALLALGLKCKP